MDRHTADDVVPVLRGGAGRKAGFGSVWSTLHIIE